MSIRPNTVIPIDDAAGHLWAVLKEFDLADQEQKLMSYILSACPCVRDNHGKAYFKLDQFNGFLTNIAMAVRRGDMSFLVQKRGFKVDHVADVEEFVESKFYMNQKGHIRPRIKYELQRLFASDQYVEAVLTGAIGIGKNYFGDLAMAYMVYLLSCYYNPQMEFGLAPGSSIVFITQSISLSQARKVAFDQFAQRLKLSPYFTNYFPFDPNIKSELRFPNNIYVMPVGGSDTGAIGMNVFGGLIDEMNFMARVQDSVNILHTSEDEYDQAERLYNAIIKRMKSRFNQYGSLPGKLLLISSVNYPGDFTDRKIEESKVDPSVFIMKLALWESVPTETLSTERFRVEVGNDYKRTRILEKGQEPLDPEDVIEVPMDYYMDFRRDLDGALRDLAGVATGTKHPFIPYREEIEIAQSKYEADHQGRSLFRVEACIIDEVLPDPDNPDWDLIVDLGYIDEHILDPATVFACHIDVGVSQDALGLAIGRIYGYQTIPASKVFVPRTGEFRELRDVRMPLYHIDGVLQVKASYENEVDLELVRDMMLYLRGILNIKWITMDSYQSTMMRQAFRKSRIRSDLMSVDTSIAPYAEVKQAIKDERILLPRHEAMARELREIELTDKGKIDHPAGGSKDCADAVAGVVYILQTKEATYGRPVSTTGRTRGKRRTTSGRGRAGRTRKLKVGRG